MSSFKIGRWGEEMLASLWGLQRVPFSGGLWPHTDDLIGYPNVGSFPEKMLVQVKTTQADTFLQKYRQLVANARRQHAHPRWIEIIKTPQAAYIFERVLIQRVELGIGGDYGRG